MLKINKKSVYGQKREETNITDFVQKKAERSYRIERGTDNGKAYLRIVVPNEKAPGGESNVDCSFLLGFPALCDPFITAMVKRFKDGGDGGGAITLGTCVTITGNLKCGFFRYLQSKGMAGIDLASMSPKLVSGFFYWLDQKRDKGLVLSLATKARYAECAKSLFRTIHSLPEWVADLRDDLYIPNPWSNDTPDVKLTETIPDREYGMIYNACKKEIAETMAQVRHMRSLMEANLDHPIARRPDSPLLPDERIFNKSPYRDLGLVLATVRNRTPQVILRPGYINNMKDRQLDNAIRQYHGDIPAIYRCFYPNNRDLLPFILMMTIHFDYNPETILASNIQDFGIRENELGQTVFDVFKEDFSEQDDVKSDDSEAGSINALPSKGRAKGKQQHQIRPATNDPDNPAAIYEFLVEWTKFIRPVANPMFAERLFLYMPQTREPIARSFFSASTGLACADTGWKSGLINFYKAHGLPHHSLKRIRPTGLDVTDTLFGGDIRLTRAAANHVNFQTTYSQYNTHAQQARGDEQLGNITEQRLRWRQTGGKSDPRNKPKGADLAAATPGWTCVDPYSGPFTIQNKLCDGFGRCPVCPHSAIDVNDSYSVAQAYNLLAAVDEAAARLAPQAWLERWAPVKGKLLNYWMQQFPQSIIDQAKMMNLRPLPSLE